MHISLKLGYPVGGLLQFFLQISCQGLADLVLLVKLGHLLLCDSECVCCVLILLQDVLAELCQVAHHLLELLVMGQRSFVEVSLQCLEQILSVVVQLLS